MSLAQQAKEIIYASSSGDVRLLAEFINELLDQMAGFQIRNQQLEALHKDDLEALELSSAQTNDVRIDRLKASMRAQDAIVDELQGRNDEFIAAVRIFIGMLTPEMYDEIFDDKRGYGMRQLKEANDYIRTLLQANNELQIENYQLLKGQQSGATKEN